MGLNMAFGGENKALLWEKKKNCHLLFVLVQNIFKVFAKDEHLLSFSSLQVYKQVK